jgi:23S rRNA (adenine2503-C2)-methyltransferase
VKIIKEQGREGLAIAYAARMREGEGFEVEFVESLQPPIPREEKWVLIVSTLFGCPYRCTLCDAGGHYQGKLAREEILAQLDFLVRKRFQDGRVPVPKFKVQFARMGDPALNPAVIELLAELPRRYHAPGLMPCISSIAPKGSEGFWETLIGVKEAHYPSGRFQLQFSIHTTDEGKRRELIPARTWSFAEMGNYGKRFVEAGDRKIALNFALAEGYPIAPSVLRKHFDPARFLVKLTPLNPTYQAERSGLRSSFGHQESLVRELKEAGYEVIESFGEAEENHIRSNCGQLIRSFGNRS